MAERLDLDALEALLAEATPGEWLNRGTGSISARTPQHAEGDGFTIQTELTPVAQMGAGDGWRGRAHGEHDAGDHDATLIVALRNAAPELIKRLHALESNWADIGDLLNGCGHCEYDEAEGLLIDHCALCCRQVTAAVFRALSTKDGGVDG